MTTSVPHLAQDHFGHAAASRKKESPILAGASMDRFFCARGAVTLIYRKIIRDDLLQKILHEASMILPNVRPGFEFLDKEAASANGDPRIPLEFSTRLSGSATRWSDQRYRFNERPNRIHLAQVLMQNSAKLPTLMPFDRKWIARWSQFFEIDGVP